MDLLCRLWLKAKTPLLSLAGTGGFTSVRSLRSLNAVRRTCSLCPLFKGEGQPETNIVTAGVRGVEIAVG
jgi:hypothetical protein